MVSIVPFLPSFHWYVRFLQSLQDGANEMESIEYANGILSLMGKEYGRTVISERDKRRTISVSIVGGNATLKYKGNLPIALLSDHGDWRQNHLKTFEALYGKTAFFSEIFPMLKMCYSADDHSLPSFNHSLHEALLSILLPDTHSLSQNITVSARERGLELAEVISPDLTLLDSLMRFGPETLLPLLVWKEK